MQQNVTGTAVAAAPCWICGAVADTGEHKAKRSDLKDVFGPVSQSSPLFLNDASNKSRRVRSITADAMKWDRTLCQVCNSTRTQPHDEAWSTMSKGLRSWTPALAPGSVVRANRIFPAHTARAMLNVHLYFAKAFGCLAVKAADKSAKIDPSTFARAIMEGRAQPDLYLAFGIVRKGRYGPVVSASDLSIVKDVRSSSADLVTWFYNVNGMCVLVAYAPDVIGSLWARKERLWHPRDGSNRFIMRDISEEATASRP